jgi:hypothetical protein
MAKCIIWEIKIRIADAELPADDQIQQLEPTQIDFVEIDEVLAAVKAIGTERQPRNNLLLFGKAGTLSCCFR